MRRTRQARAQPQERTPSLGAPASSSPQTPHHDTGVSGACHGDLQAAVPFGPCTHIFGGQSRCTMPWPFVHNTKTPAVPGAALGHYLP